MLNIAYNRFADYYVRAHAKDEGHFFYEGLLFKTLYGYKQHACSNLVSKISTYPYFSEFVTSVQFCACYKSEPAGFLNNIHMSRIGVEWKTTE